jgi:hypothetical protein
VSAPSLAPRAVERQPIELPVPAPSEHETAADPSLDARLQPLLAKADEGQRDFDKQRSQADAAVARAAGATPGDEAWTVAQQALSALDATRGAVHDAAAAVDAMRQEPAFTGTGSRAAIEAAAARIATIADAQAVAFAALQARLP